MRIFYTVITILAMLCSWTASFSHNDSYVAASNAPTMDAVVKSSIDVAAQIQREEFHQEQIACLTVNMYNEASNQGRRGMTAVGAVTLNRVNSDRYPDTVCEVVFDRCQFSWVCDDNIEGIDPATLDHPSLVAYNTAKRIATDLYSRCDMDERSCSWDDPTRGAMYYHASYVKPYWADPKHGFQLATTIGDHNFYHRLE